MTFLLAIVLILYVTATIITPTVFTGKNLDFCNIKSNTAMG